MIAAYRFRGLGWFGACAAMVLSFYLVSLQVAHERNRLEALNRSIAGAERDIRALETEFDTRANLQQLERWNGDILALSAPGAGQFMRGGAQLASVRFDSGPVPAGEGEVRTAALVVPSLPAPAPVEPASAVQTAAVAAMPQVAAAAPIRAVAVARVVARAPVRSPATRSEVAAAPARRARTPNVAVAAAPVPQPARGRTSKVAVAAAAPASVPRPAMARMQRVAMLDGALLADLGSRARAEASRR